MTRSSAVRIVSSAALLSLLLVSGSLSSAAANDVPGDEVIVTATLVPDDGASRPASVSDAQLASDFVPVLRQKTKVRPKPVSRREPVRRVVQRIEPLPVFRPIMLYLGVAF
jgi:hypothetical protein